MDPFDLLGLEAQVAATLLGFLAIFVVLSDKEGRFVASDRHFVQTLVLAGCFVIAMSLLPGILSHFVRQEVAWRAVAITAALVGAMIALIQGRFQLTMPRDEAQKIHWAWHLGSWTLGVGAEALVVLALFGFLDIVAAYVTSISLMVLLTLWAFIAIVFRRFF